MQYTIYRITDVITKKSYIGSTKQKLYKRINVHKAFAKRGVNTKFCRHIRSVFGTEFTKEEWNDRFHTTVLQKTPHLCLAEFYEANYIHMYNSYWDCYNSTPTGLAASTHRRGTKHSKESRAKISKSRKGIYKGSKNPAWRHDIQTEELIWRRESGMTFEDIGKEVGMSKDAVRQRLLHTSA